VQLTRVEVEVGDLSQQDADVAVALEDRAQGIGDLARRERPGRDLVGERLEEMEVAAVISTGARRSFKTACRPPKPPPTTTTWWRGPEASGSRERGSRTWRTPMTVAALP
jgi:hypothetical protein